MGKTHYVDHTKNAPTVLSFCSGYGGIERGLDIAGFKHRVITYVEIEAYAIANLVAKMESNQLDAATIYSDIKTFPSHIFRDKVSVITGGYPCQPFSVAAKKRKGEKDPRNLWEFIREHIKTIRPIWCFFENVEGHLKLGLQTVIKDLESLGYASTFGIFGTKELGFIHERKRVFILAHSDCQRCKWWQNQNDIQKRIQELPKVKQAVVWSKIERRVRNEISPGFSAKPLLDRRTDGTSNRLDRLRLLGNGVVPQTAAKAWLTLNQKLLEQNETRCS